MSNYCLYCDTLLINEMDWIKLIFPKKESPLCQECREKLEPISDDYCKVCSRPLKEIKPKFVEQRTCIDCIRWEQDPRWKGTLDKNVSIYAYNPFLKELIARFKFRGDYELAKAFSPEISAKLKILEHDLLVAIPLSDERLKERGFNQSEALARETGFVTWDLLIRTHSEKQSKKSREERLSQRQIFQLKNVANIIQGKNILLIDDIYTTGSTLRQAAKMLKQTGAKQVQSLTVARG
ncbi:ComF family protein [Bacillus sp. FJAT-49732]|uniref:ComF family protein n=1 Tax=Lederbergia citrisecunda TaxID=2833583 RepID=A0A942YNK9_9BACI|nr:ComF family protein [Lederbergia citrisecunda]MBS4200406.1 ComF family protein [Lederbergia citrisecunda]